MNSVFDLKDSGITSDRFGGKAANLSILTRANLPVPSGIAISIEAFTKKGELLKSAKTLIENNLVPARTYAVRSSATVEDSAENSWAGQFESYLYVNTKDVLHKVEQCHAAVRTRAKAYAAQSGSAQNIVVGVVVQEMIDPAFAGVVFTRNPVSGAHEIVAEYVRGVGEQLVSGVIDPEEFTYSREDQKITSGKKVPFDTDGLIKMSQDIETLFGDAPQDIEWAIDKNDKLWITQSRPITTLSIEQTGMGYHYLGDPGGLFYWGPASARTLYMSDFLHAVRDMFNSWQRSDSYPNPPKTLLLFHENKSLWLNKKKAFEKFVEGIFEEYVRTGDIDADIKAWREAVEKIDENKIYTPKELLQLLDNVWRPTFNAEFALYGAEATITKELLEYSEGNRHRIWGTFSLPETPNFINQIDKQVIRLKDPKKLAAVFPWALNSYAGVANPSNVVTYFTQRIRDLEGNEEIIHGEKIKRDILAKELKLATDIKRQLNIARRIAEFMDERKAWMMQSRTVIQRMAEAEAERRGIDTQLIESCQLEDIVHNNIDEYFGWTFVEGKNIDLSKKDVERSWNWYVEYKAATNVLKGIVSSRGGKHFMVGEVVVVHDPAEQVADGKIVVVPSTGPSYVPIMRKAAALVTDHGGMMSHAAIVAREFNLPCIVGTVHATKVLNNGDKVLLDLVKGEVNK